MYKDYVSLDIRKKLQSTPELFYSVFIWLVLMYGTNMGPDGEDGGGSVVYASGSVT